jgi:hypothetical protein
MISQFYNLKDEVEFSKSLNDVMKSRLWMGLLVSYGKARWFALGWREST